MRGEAKCRICLKSPPEYCMFPTHKQGGALIKCYIVLPGHLAQSNFL